MKKVNFWILLIILAFPFACKYEDGPLISLRSPEKRLYGYYTLIKYTVDNVDSLSLFYDSLPLNFNIWYNDVTYNNICNISGSRSDGYYSSITWVWELKNNDKIFKIIQDFGTTSTGPFGTDKTPEWEILKLSNRKVRMETIYNGKKYYIELKK